MPYPASDCDDAAGTALLILFGAVCFLAGTAIIFFLWWIT